MTPYIVLEKVYLNEKHQCFFYLNWDEITIYIKTDGTIREYAVNYDNFINIFADIEEFKEFNDVEIESLEILEDFVGENLEIFLNKIINSVNIYGELRKIVTYGKIKDLDRMFADLLSFEYEGNHYEWV